MISIDIAKSTKGNLSIAYGIAERLAFSRLSQNAPFGRWGDDGEQLIRCGYNAIGRRGVRHSWQPASFPWEGLVASHAPSDTGAATQRYTPCAARRHCAAQRAGAPERFQYRVVFIHLRFLQSYMYRCSRRGWPAETASPPPPLLLALQESEVDEMTVPGTLVCLDGHVM